MSKDNLRQFANLLSVILALAVNVLATALPLNNQTTAQISDRFKVYFVPAGYVFAIWGLIYIGWIAFVVYQFLPAHKESPRLRKLGYTFALSGVFNAAWLFCWQYNHFTLSVIVMLILLGLLIASYLNLNVGRTPVGAAEKWCVDIPFSVYLGWISVATIANISDWLYYVHWNGFGLDPQTLGYYHADGRLCARTYHRAQASGRRLPVRLGLGFRRDPDQAIRNASDCRCRFGRGAGGIRTGDLHHHSTLARVCIIFASTFLKAS